MPLTRPTYRVAIDALTNEHEIPVLPADQLRAEVEGNRRGLVEPAKQSMLLTFLWLWAACRRVGVVGKEEKFEPFVERLVAWERVKQEGDPDHVPTVDPTQEAASSTPASTSTPASPASTGSVSSTPTPPSSPPPSDTSSLIPTDPASGERFAGDPPTGHEETP